MASETDMMTAAARRRESRREKILARGSDRLALISGRVSSISPESNADRPARSANITAASPTSEEDADCMIRGLNFNPSDTRNVPSTISGAEIEASRYAGSDTSQLPVSSMNGTSSTNASGTVQGLEAPTQRLSRTNRFNSKQISLAIEASHKTRVLFSLLAAAFVVLSHLGFPLLQGKVVKGIVYFRPLFLVLLTNLTNVAARVLLNGSENNEGSHRSQSGSGSQKEYGWLSQIEVMLAMQKLMNALVMDCSVYIVALVCGLCFT